LSSYSALAPSSTKPFKAITSIVARTY
jgi:hypothetical protein